MIESLKQKRNDHYAFVDVMAITVISVIIFASMEIAHPFYFLQDDNGDFYLCMYRHTLRAFSAGEFPLFNFYSNSGIPFFENGQNGALNPFVYIAGGLSFLLFGCADATVDIMALLFILLGSISFYFLLRFFGAGRLSCCLGAVAWGFNSFNIFCGSNWIIVIMTSGCLPLMMLATLMAARKPSLKMAFISALPRMLLFYCGHPQFFLYAVIFEFLMLVLYLIISGKKGKSPASNIAMYFGSYIAVVLWCLPLLVPMYLAMQASAIRGDILAFDEFAKLTLEPAAFVLGLFFPFLNKDNVLYFDENGNPYKGAGDAPILLQKNYGHMGYILAFCLVLGLFIVLMDIVHRCISKEKKETAGTDRRLSIMEMVLPLFILAIIWACSGNFNHLVYLIPYLNRFRWPFKLLLYAEFFAVIFAAMTLDMLIDRVKNRLAGKNAVKIACILLLLAETLNFALMYALMPVRSLNVLNGSSKPYSDELTQLISEGRYMPVVYPLDFWDDEGYHRGLDIAGTFAYGFPMYYGLHSRTSYHDQMESETTAAYNSCIEAGYSDSISGICQYLDENLIGNMRETGVNWYISSSDYRNMTEPVMAGFGIVPVYDDGRRVVYYDPEAMPLVYTSESGDGGNIYIRGLEFTESINELSAVTPDDFAGGTVTANFIYNRNFHAYVDGKEVPVIADEYFRMSTEVPSGSHAVIWTYEDRCFNICICITAIFTIGVLITLLIAYRKNDAKDDH